MSENNDKLEWIRLAEMDLAAAHHLFITFHPKPLEIICFHSQQAVEKMLKCYLVTHDIEPPKTHDIQLLLEMCLEISDDYDDVYENATTLTNYAVRLRYPAELGLVELDAKKALDIADRVMAHVKAKMVQEKSKEYKYTSMNYIELDECKNAEVLYDSSDMILLYDKSKTPAMLHFAVNDFECLINTLAEIQGGLRLHFVPKEFAAQLKSIGFVEWGEYVDFFNLDLADTASHFADIDEAEYLNANECEDVSTLSRRCEMQSRGFEGESPEWFKEWITENKVIILRKDANIIGYCCVSIYNEGTMLWIREIAVSPDCQGSGVGTKLIEQAIMYGIQNGAVKGFLHVDMLNKNAIRLYEKFGFIAKNEDSELQMIRC